MRRLYVLLAALLLAAVALPAAAQAAGCNGSAKLCDRRFDRVVLAGAHNAMAARDAGFTNPNHRVGITKQLQLGVRALLIDVYWGRDDGTGKVVTDRDGPLPGSTLHLCHVACELGATPLSTALEELGAFLAANPNDVVQLVVEDHVAPEAFQAAVEASPVGALLHRGTTRAPWPTLRQMVAAGGRVVVLAENRVGAVPWYRLAYEGVLQETPYSFAEPELLTRRSAWRASCKPNRGGRTGSLFLMNHWSPPYKPTYRTSQRVNAKAVLLGRTRTCEAVRKRLPTTIAVDYADVGGLIAAVRELNR